MPSCTIAEPMKDTVAEQDEDDEVDTVQHSAVDSALRLDGVEHHFVPVFAGQYLHPERPTLRSISTPITSFTLPSHAAVTTTIRLRFDGRPTAIRLPITGH